MSFNQGIANEIARWTLIVILLVFFVIGFLIGGIWMLLNGLLIGLLLVIFAALWLYIMVIAFYSMAAITLSDDGVAIRVFMRTKHYMWDEIAQVGVLRRARQYGHYNDLVLLPKTGLMCNPQERSFMLKNQFQLIHLPYTPDAISYVLSHYGPLDFDYSNEQGIKKH